MTTRIEVAPDAAKMLKDLATAQERLQVQMDTAIEMLRRQLGAPRDWQLIGDGDGVAFVPNTSPDDADHAS